MLYHTPGSGYEPPAAIILETVQGEGGLNCAQPRWLKKIERLCRELGALLIVDDIQAGCGRTGTFFSFELSGISPDIICLSKSISGYGLPMSVVLIKPEHDCWEPGEHNGTFRGNNHAFITASAALDFWQDRRLEAQINNNSVAMRTALEKFLSLPPPETAHVVGRGMFLGLKFNDPQTATRLSRACLEQRLLVETCGPSGEVLKLMPPLTIDSKVLARGLEKLQQAYLSIMPSNSLPGIA